MRLCGFRSSTWNGPAHAIAVQDGNVVVAVMHNVLTKAEKALAINGREGEVAELRHLFQNGRKPTFAAPLSGSRAAR